MAVTTPQFALPFRIGKTVAIVEQDSVEEIEQCVETVLSTPVGSLIDAPALGRPDETFKQQGPDVSAESYLEAVDKWEPRAHVLGEAAIEELATKVVTIKSGVPNAV